MYIHICNYTRTENKWGKMMNMKGNETEIENKTQAEKAHREWLEKEAQKNLRYAYIHPCTLYIYMIYKYINVPIYMGKEAQKNLRYAYIHPCILYIYMIYNYAHIYGLGSSEESKVYIHSFLYTIHIYDI